VTYIRTAVCKQETLVCIEDAEGAILLAQRIRTTRERFTALLGGQPRARIPLEAATESECDRAAPRDAQARGDRRRSRSGGAAAGGRDRRMAGRRQERTPLRRPYLLDGLPLTGAIVPV